MNFTQTLGETYTCDAVFENGTRVKGVVTNMTCSIARANFARNSTDLVEATIRVHEIESGREVLAFGIQIFDSKCREAEDPLVLRSNLCIKGRNCYRVGESESSCFKCGEDGAWQREHAQGKFSFIFFHSEKSNDTNKHQVVI